MRRWLLFVLLGGYLISIGTPASDAAHTPYPYLRLYSVQQPVRIMPLGDSVTYGVESDDGGGYRTLLWQLLQRGKTKVDFVGSVKAGPTNIDPDNEGYPGYTITDLMPLLQHALTTYQPQIILLHIGTNDIGSHVAPAEVANRLRIMLERIRSLLPHVLILVAQIVPRCSFEPAVADYNARIPAIVASMGANANIGVVNIQSALTLNELNDCVHPKEYGYQRMAYLWYDALRPILALPPA